MTQHGTCPRCGVQRPLTHDGKITEHGSTDARICTGGGLAPISTTSRDLDKPWM